MNLILNQQILMIVFWTFLGSGYGKSALNDSFNSNLIFNFFKSFSFDLQCFFYLIDKSNQN